MFENPMNRNNSYHIESELRQGPPPCFLGQRVARLGLNDGAKLWNSFKLEVKSYEKSPDFDAKLRPYAKNFYGSQKVCKKLQILMQNLAHIQRILMVVKSYAKTPDFDAN